MLANGRNNKKIALQTWDATQLWQGTRSKQSYQSNQIGRQSLPLHSDDNPECYLSSMLETLKQVSNADSSW